MIGSELFVIGNYSIYFFIEVDETNPGLTSSNTIPQITGARLNLVQVHLFRTRLKCHVVVNSM